MPETEHDTKTADGFLADTLDWMQRCTDYTNTCIDGSGKFDPADPKYMQAIMGSVSGFQIVVLMEALRLTNPVLADYLARDIESALDDGGVIGELLYEWQESRKAGEAISTPVNLSPGSTYKSIWQRALDAS